MQNKPEQYKQYRLLRFHKFDKSKINSIIRPKSCDHKLQNQFSLKTTCQIIQQQKNAFYIHTNDNKLAIYDSSTFVQSTFNTIYKNINKQKIWDNLISDISLNSNFLMLYLQSSQKQNTILTNDQLIKSNLKSNNNEKQNNKQDYGIIEKTISHLLNQINKDEDEQLLISMIGFSSSGSNMIDLLNFDQDFTKKPEFKLKIKKQMNSISVQNLSQIAIQTIQSFYNIFLLSSYIKQMYSQQTQDNIQTQLFQIFVGKLSKGKVNIDKIKNKYNFVNLHRNQSTLINSVGNCLKQLIQNKGKVVSTRNSKLTFILEDCLNIKSKIHIFSEIDNRQSISSQINILNFNNYIERAFVIKKNYIGNNYIINKLKKYGNQKVLNDIAIQQNKEKNRQKIKRQKFRAKYLSKISKALMSQTICSISKRKAFLQNSPEQKSQQKSQIQQQTNKNFSTNKISRQDKYSIIRRVYQL